MNKTAGESASKQFLQIAQVFIDLVSLFFHRLLKFIVPQKSVSVNILPCFCDGCCRFSCFFRCFVLRMFCFAKILIHIYIPPKSPFDLRSSSFAPRHSLQAASALGLASVGKGGLGRCAPSGMWQTYHNSFFYKVE